MNQSASYKVCKKGKSSLSNNEVGASMLEAGIIMSILFPVILFSLYLFIISYRLTTTHYLMQDSLRQILTVVPSASGSVSLEEARSTFMKGGALAEHLESNFDNFGYKFLPEDFLLRNGDTCFRLAGKKFKIFQNQDLECFGTAGTPIKPSSFVRLELDVKYLSQQKASFKTLGIEFTNPKVIVGARIGEL